jgi:HSP20 family protein
MSANKLLIGVNNMLPARKFFVQNFMPNFFGDLFENVNIDGRVMKSPAINVIEDDDRYCLEVAAPGLSKDDFKVHVNRDGNLVIEMEKKGTEEHKECCDGKECKEGKNRRYIRREFTYAKFRQTLLLPENAERDEIHAKVENGVAASIKPQFEEMDEETLAVIIERYQNQDTWKENLIFSKEGFDLLQAILMDAGVIEEPAVYEELVNTAFATQVK